MHRGTLTPVALLTAALITASCSPEAKSDGQPVTNQAEVLTTVVTTPSAPLDAVRPLLAIRDAGTWRADGGDDIEVWICSVPSDSTTPIFAGLPLRLALTPAAVAEVLNARVAAYFNAISHGLYQPRFLAGDVATLRADQDPQTCVEQAIVGADDTTDAVLVVADAENRPEFPGGFGNAGVPCPAQPPCPVLDSRRAAYVGASDFHPDWGSDPPLDLVEHEIGHTLGWTHSGFVSGATQPYQSRIDLMSNSAAPREQDPTRRDGPDTLAVNRLLAGWLAEADVWVAPPSGGAVQLQSSTGAIGTRVALVALADGNYLSVELLTPEGFNAHLLVSGVAVHRVMLANGAVQTIVTLAGADPSTLLQPGQFLETDGWRIEVVGGAVAISPIY